MTVEIDIEKYGDYGLLFVALCNALKDQEHAGIQANCEQMAHLARQKHVEGRASPAGVVRKAD